MTDNDDDPQRNHVTFHLRIKGKETTLSGVGPARAVDCISALWQALAPGSGARAADVYEVYSEWEPASEDMAFLDQTFPEDAELGYTFKRPDDDGWDAALAAASEVIKASAKSGS